MAKVDTETTVSEDLDAAPTLKVLGHMNERNIAVQLGWRRGMTVISMSRYKFLKDELGFDVTDEKDQYLF